jgi:hypothetical protein
LFLWAWVLWHSPEALDTAQLRWGILCLCVRQSAI